jgi:nitroreductase
MFAAGNYLADHFAHTPVLLVFCFNPKIMAITDAKLDRVSVVGGASIYTAVQNTLLACRGEGLGCVLTTLLCASEDEVRSILEIPEPWGTAAAIPIGYPVLGGHGPISRRPIEKLAFADRWGTAYSRSSPTRG